MTGDLPRRLTRTWGDPAPAWDHVIGGPPVTDTLTPRTPQVGDTITTAEELDTLPIGTILAAVESGAPAGIDLAVRWSDSWRTDGIPWPIDPSWHFPLTVLYLPGHPPRPEREVKAEALREFAAQVRDTYPRDIFSQPSREHLAAVHAFCQSQGRTLDAISAHIMRLAAARAENDADRIARGDS